MHKTAQINVSSNFGRNTKSQSLILICSSQNLGGNLRLRSNWSTSTSWWGFSPYSKLATWVEGSRVGCGPAATAISVFCRRELDLCERQTLTACQQQRQNADWWKKRSADSKSTNRCWCRAWGSLQALRVGDEWSWPGEVRVFPPAASSLSGDGWCFSP